VSLLADIQAWVKSKDMNERALTPAQIFNTGLDDWYDTQTSSGITMTAEAAMQSAIGACVRLLADDISSLPLDVFRKVGGDSVEMETPDWLARPSGALWDTPASLVSDMVVSLGTDGNVFLLATPNVWDIARIDVLDPASVDIREQNGNIIYRVNGKRDFNETNIVHIPWIRLPGQLRGINVVTASKDSSGLELAAREWAGRFFGNGATLGGLIETPTRLSKEEMAELRKQFAMRHQGRRKSHLLGVLSGGAKYNATSLKPQEAELKPLWAHVLEEAARIFHIPPHLLASQDPGGSSYSSVEQRSIEYVQHAVVSFTTRIERPLSRLVAGDDTFVKLNVNGLLRGDFQTRAQGYRALLESRVITKETVRALEDLPKDDTEVGYLDTPNNQTRDFRTEDARALVLAGYDPAAVLEVVGLPAMPYVGAAAAPPQQDAGRTVLEFGDVKVGDETLAGLIAAQQAQGEAIRKTETSLEQRLTAFERRIVAAMTAKPEPEPFQPKQTEVVRDDRGRIVSVIERQGDRTVRRVIERDANGSFITMREVAA